MNEWIAERFRMPAPGPSKVTTLRAAIADGVRPGDAVHLGITHCRGSAAFWELLRQFRGADPGFTLLCVTTTTPFAPLVHAGLARKIVTSWSGSSYYTPGPNPVYQRAWKQGVEFEHWSILTFPQRLEAAARGLEEVTTRSLVGSDMERNGRTMDGAFLIPALRPDVSIMHAPAADASGNVLLSPPLMEGPWGPLAAKRGTIVTVEKIVGDDYVREHAHMVAIPAHAVRAVVEAPLGGHPGGLKPAGLDGIRSYQEDYEFWMQIREASKTKEAMDDWIDRWITETKTHDGYVEKLGADRIAALKNPRDEPIVISVEEPNPIERAIVASARLLMRKARDLKAETMLAGAGMANLAAWLAAYELQEIDLVAEMGLVGYWPRPGEPMLFNQRNFPTCTMLSDISTTLGVLIAGRPSLGSLGAAQVDKAGNINSTEIPGEMLLMGSGGANDVATCATETVLTVAQSRERFLDRVPYITAPGDRVTALVSDLGIFEKDQGELVLTGVFDENGVEAARERCGWDLRVARKIETIPGPTEVEVRMLRAMDPKGFFRT